MAKAGFNKGGGISTDGMSDAHVEVLGYPEIRDSGFCFRHNGDGGFPGGRFPVSRDFGRCFAQNRQTTLQQTFSVKLVGFPPFFSAPRPLAAAGLGFLERFFLEFFRPQGTPPAHPLKAQFLLRGSVFGQSAQVLQI